MAQSIGMARPELVQIADTVARDKGIDREEVFQAMEQAIQKAGRSKYGHENDIRAAIDRKNGEIRLARYMTVVEVIENENTQLLLDKAQRKDPKIEVGGVLIDPLPPIDFGRIAAQTAKQVIVQKVRDAERSRQFSEYKDRIGEIVNGLVKRVEFGNVIVDLGRAEGLLRRDELIPREHFKNGDRVRAYIVDVREEPRGPQIFLSRTAGEFMSALFAQEVPEIYDGIIEIKACARDPGSRAKIAVISNDSSIDPVGACVGMRGSRVQAVVAELQGEKIDIIQWNQDPATFVVNALAPAEVTKVVLDEDSGRIEVVVPDDQLSLAIGRRGQNVRLASQLTGWTIDILTEGEESERRQEEFRSRSKMFIDALDVDDVLAHLLVTEGFTSVEEVAFVPLEELTDIEGFDEDIANELKERATAYIEEENKKIMAKMEELGVAQDLSEAEIEGLDPRKIIILAEKGVKTLDDLADLAGDELVEMLGADVLKEDAANAIIMAARAHWFPEGQQRRDGRRSRVSRLEGQAGRMEAPDANRDAEHGSPCRSRSPAWTMPGRGQGPNRRCIVSGESLPLAQLIRFVVGPDGKVVPDIDRRLPGRGLWLRAERGMIELAVSKRAFAKAVRGNVTVAPDLADTVAELLRRRCLNHLGLARRAGLVAAGAEKVRAQIATGRTAVLFEAADGSPQERRKFTALAPHLPVVDVFTGAELGSRSWGATPPCMSLLQEGALTTTLIEDAARYAGERWCENGQRAAAKGLQTMTLNATKVTNLENTPKQSSSHRYS